MKLSLQERDRRHQAIRNMMADKEYSILIAASNAMWTGHVRYLSNYPPHFGYSYVIFPREGNATIFVFSGIQERVAATRWIPDARQSSDYPGDIVKRVKEIDYKGKRIGLVGVENISFGIYNYMRSELPEAIFVDATRDLLDLRMVKSAEEQALARECARITDGLFARVKEIAKVGMSEFDIYAEMDYFIRKHGIEAAFNLIGSGPCPVAPFLSPSDRKVGEGDSLLLELTPRYEGFYTQLTGYVHLTPPTAKMKEYLDVGFRAKQEGVKLLKPGNRACDVANAMKAVVEKAGYAYVYRGGHGMGHDLDEAPAIVPSDETVLKAGMTLVIHPSVIDKNGQGVFIGDSWLVTDNGPERLNQTFASL